MPRSPSRPSLPMRMPLLALLIPPVLVACDVESGAQSVPTTRQSILVDPAGGSLAGYRTVKRLADVPFASLAPGSGVIVRGGTYPDVVVIGSRGSADLPVTVVADPGTTPVLSNSVVFENAAYVSVSGLTVRGATNSGFIIRRGSSHVTVASSTVAKSGLGVWIGDRAGAGHRIVDNTLADNLTHGVAIDVINVPASDPTYILGNTVTGNGIHGMEINGSGYIVEGNRVSGNGTKMSGTSGIHVYAKTASQDAGDRNTIRYNIVTAQQETTGQDGNGIQLDQWCDDNIVAFNVASGNDGAGIHLFDAGGNTVFNNTLAGNMLNSGGKHLYRGEIVLASDSDRQIDRTSNNRVFNNIAVATKADVGAITVEPTTTDNNNALGPNMVFNTAGGRLYRWGTVNTDSGASLPLNGAAPDLVEQPRFVDSTKPITGGLALAAAPSRAGLPVGAARDIAGAPYAAGEAPTFGAYRSP